MSIAPHSADAYTAIMYNARENSSDIKSYWTLSPVATNYSPVMSAEVIKK
jgi:hypothetical protein